MTSQITPDFIARITLYPTEKGGRKSPIVAEPYGCPCKFDVDDISTWDCRILTGGERFSPGETREFGVKFGRPEIAPAFGLVDKFYLWEGRIIGEGFALR